MTRGEMTEQQVATVPTKVAGAMYTGGRWGWYLDHEGVAKRRVSTLVKKVETDTYNLDQWMKRQVAEGLAVRDDLVYAIKAMGRPDPVEGWSKTDKKKLDGIVKDAEAAAKQRDGGRAGTAMHDLTERLDRGESIEDVVRGLPALPAQSLRAYDFLRRENGWRNIEIERTVECEELEVRGTFDRVDVVPGLASLLGPGRCQYGDACPDAGFHLDSRHELPVVVDVKTETAPWLNGLHIGPQLAIYSRSTRMWLPNGRMKTITVAGEDVTVADGSYVPAPCVRQDVAIVAHVLDGEAVPYFVNLAEGWDAAVAAYDQAQRETRAKRKLGAGGSWFVPVPNVKRPAVAQMLTEQAVAAQYADPGRPPAVAPHAEGERTGGGHVAVRRSDGTVGWEAEPPVGTVTTVAGQQFTKVDTMADVVTRGALDDVDKQAVETIWAATDLSDLGRVWKIYTEVVGRTWGGRVAEAADARRAQIECPQRALHTTGKCACGWVPGIPA